MTSKSLLCNMCKEDIKRRLWVIALAILGFLFFLPIYFLMSLENVKRYEVFTEEAFRKQKLIEAAIKVMGMRNTPIIIITIMLAILCAISGFAYLQSKKKVDFYHSIPVKRETFFASSYIVGITIYVVPYVVALCISFLLAKLNGVFNSELWSAAWSAFGINLLNYTIILSTVVIAILVTGHIIVSLLATAVFFAYGPAVACIYNLLANDFFDTFYSQSETGIISVLLKFSPIGAYINMIESSFQHTISTYSVGMYLLITIILALGALFLYKHRKSEVAGKAIAYKRLQPIIKVMISIPIGMYVGMFFNEFTDDRNLAWRLFGMICGYLLCSVFIEVIYHFDFKAALKSKVSLLIGGILMFVTLAIFKYDTFHFDAYVPSKDSVKSMAIVLPYMDTDTERYGVMSKRGNGDYISTTEYADEFMYLKDTEVAYEIAKRAVKHNHVISEDNNTYEYCESESIGRYTTLNVIYRLKSGRKVYRSYNVRISDFYDDLNKIYQTEEYKKGIFEFYRVSNIESISCSNEFDDVVMSLSKEECNQFKKLYLEELTALSFDDIVKASPSAKVTMIADQHRYELKIYPSYTHTIEFLTNHGFDFTKTYDINDIEYVNVDYVVPHDLRDTAVYQEYLEKNPKWNYSFSISYKEKDKIKQLLPYLVRADYTWHDHLITNYVENLRITVSVKTDNYGNKDSREYIINQKKMPEWLMNDIMYSEVDSN